MMKSLAIMASLATLVMAVASPVSAQTGSNNIEGLWLTENGRAAVQLEKCENGASLCGEIAWIIAGGMQMDTQNEDAALRERPLCGMQILYGFHQGKQANEWLDGKIYKADDGDIYNASITQVDENRLRLRGYVGMPLFGKTQMWKRVDPAEYPSCD